MTLAVPLTRSRLQALAECDRRFWLAWLAQVPWPSAATSAAAEEALARGREFHRLMERHFMGLPVEPMAPDLRTWWTAWGAYPLALPPGRTRPEVTVSAPFGDERLLVRYDLLVVPADPAATVLIIDWKTAARPPSRGDLAADMQTQLYPYVLVEAGEALTGRRLAPEGVELIYWLAADPAHPVRFRHTAAAHEAARRRLAALIARVHALRDAPMPPVIDDLAICARCPYRTYCGQPVPPAPAAQEPDDFELGPGDVDEFE
jgi:hypothetical protein